jgi:hypothetical protein
MQIFNFLNIGFKIKMNFELLFLPLIFAQFYFFCFDYMHKAKKIRQVGIDFNCLITIEGLII